MIPSLEDDRGLLHVEAAKITTTFLVCGISAAVAVLYHHQKKNKHNQSQDTADIIPTAPGAVPLLGHALAYKNDPALFLRTCQETVGASSIFRLNLAGRRMIVVGSSGNTASCVQCVITAAPESVLSSQRAVANVGFDYTLGRTSVFGGTDFHKRVLKDEIWNQFGSGDFLPRITNELQRAVHWELDRLAAAAAATRMDAAKSCRITIPDLFDFVRRCVMRATLNGMVGSCLLVEEEEEEKDDNNLVTEMMIFQDQIEDATAKGAVLPRFVAIPLVLQPVAMARKRLQAKIAKLIEAEREQRRQNSTTNASSNDDNNDKRRWGPWLRVFEESDKTIDEISELIIGLIFAAHKNPAIGASQSLCYLLTGNPDDIVKAKLEAKTLLDEDGVSLSKLQQLKTIHRCVTESIRLTAHSIGSIRVACKDLDIKTEDQQTYKIKEGEIVCVSHHIINTDPKIWGSDALSYRPDRFTDKETASLMFHEDQRPYASFSHGVHKCPGERVAMAVMEIMLALLLRQNAKLEGELPPISFERATLAQRDGPVAVSVDVHSP